MPYREGTRFLHRRSLHLENVAEGARVCHRGRASDAERLFGPEVPDLFYWNNMKNWAAPALCEERSYVTMETCSAFLERMYYENNNFVFSVTRDTMRGCTTPVLVMPDDTEP